MSLITPEFGLFFWMVIAFLVLLIVLRKFAWKPILSGLHDRETKISEALDRAKEAQEEIAKLEEKNKDMLRAAQAEREQLVDEARSMRAKILEEAKEEAKHQAEVYMENARRALVQEREEMHRAMRKEVADLAVKTTERILRQHFSNEQAQKEHFDRLLDEVMAGK